MKHRRAPLGGQRSLGRAAMLWVSLGAGCQKGTVRDDFAGPTARAELGVFYGGQIQERDRIPLELDSSRQSQGFRLEFDGPLREPVTIAWEIDMPGNTRGVRDAQGRLGAGRLVKLEEVLLPAGRTRFDQAIEFAPGDPFGLWNVRVRVDGEIVIDRPFEVVKP